MLKFTRQAGIRGLIKLHAIHRWNQLPVPNSEGPPYFSQSCGSRSWVWCGKQSSAFKSVYQTFQTTNPNSFKKKYHMTRNKSYLTAAEKHAKFHCNVITTKERVASFVQGQRLLMVYTASKLAHLWMRGTSHD